MIEADLRDCYKAIAEATQIDRELKRLLNRRNQLLVELRQADNPVYEQKETVKVKSTNINLLKTL